MINEIDSMQDQITSYLTNDRPKKERLLKEDMHLKLCTKCKTVWERYHLGNSYVNKYLDMPTYGLPREDCDECRKG
jgi:hypothetical protein